MLTMSAASSGRKPAKNEESNQAEMKESRTNAGESYSIELGGCNVFWWMDTQSIAPLPGGLRRSAKMFSFTAALVYRQCRSTSDKPIRFRSLRVMKKGSV
jgi:hypothetical protein